MKNLHSRNFYVGATVKLNDLGLELIFGTSKGNKYLKNKLLLVTGLVEGVTTEGDLSVKVDDPEINQFMLFSPMFDVVS